MRPPSQKITPIFTTSAPGVPNPTPPAALMPSFRARCPFLRATGRTPCKFRQIAARKSPFCALYPWLRCARGRNQALAHG